MKAKDDITRAAEFLARNGHVMVIITLGGDGCALCQNGATAFFPAYPALVRDATSAGDTFCGAFAAALADAQPLPEAIRFANAAGALCVSVAGALPSIPSKGEILAFLNQHRGSRSS